MLCYVILISLLLQVNWFLPWWMDQYSQTRRARYQSRKLASKSNLVYSKIQFPVLLNYKIKVSLNFIFMFFIENKLKQTVLFFHAVMWCTGQASAMSCYAERLFPRIRSKQERARRKKAKFGIESGATSVNFRKISVRKSIWDLEFSEHLS